MNPSKSKVEIGWKKLDADGERMQVEARKFGGVWSFYVRSGRNECWIQDETPPLDDWLKLHDAVKRRMSRRQGTPADLKKLEGEIRKHFPEHRF